ncbi:ATP-binding cassette domain-containing protein [archaeon]|nr:ATP-binding cassette domain-containing protein [archaeon]
MIECKKLCKTYFAGTPSQVDALTDVSLKIKTGEFIVVTGPSGSGKSTLLHLLSALDRPSSGKVLINNKDTSHKTDKELSLLRRNLLGFIFQGFNLIPIISAIENVALPLIPTKTNREEIRERAVKLLESVGLGHRLDHKPIELSGGERQRVAVARSLINNPRMVFADEPTGELDSKTGRSVIKLMRDLNKKQKTAFVMATHDESLIDYAKRHIKMKDGRIVEDNHNNDVKGF